MSTPRPAQSLVQEAAAELAGLRNADAAFRAHYRGETLVTQPVHTVYVSADAFGRRTFERLHDEARYVMGRYGFTPAAFAHALGLAGYERPPMPAAEATMAERFARDPRSLKVDAPAIWLAHAVHARVRARIAGHAIADLRIDFEDGYGDRPDREEDSDAVRTAAAVAHHGATGQLGGRIGIRIEPLDTFSAERAVRTLELFIDELVDRSGGALPAQLVITLPKVSHATQVSTLASLLHRLERRHGLPDGRLLLEIMVEQTQALFDPDGRCRLLAFVQAASGRCIGAHLGVYDFTASCQLVADEQRPDHPLCDLARGMMRLALGGTGVTLSDGATNVLPLEPHDDERVVSSEAQRAENEQAIARGWRASVRHITHALTQGIYQGWDMHGAQVPARYAANYAFWLGGFDRAATRLRALLSDLDAAQHVGEALDDVATAQALLGQILRAHDCGAIDDDDLRRAGLRPGEAALRSFSRIVARRRMRS